MGFFSWKCSVCNKSIPAFPYANKAKALSEVVLVLPTNQTVSGVYDGYGCIDGIDIYDELAKIFWGPSATRDKIFEDLKFIQYPNGKRVNVKMFNWETPIKTLGDKTLNQLKKEGCSIYSMHGVIQPLIKIVRKDKYTGQKYEDLKTSERCPDQGFFYKK